ncbi:hypothetical protein P691DRAFT_433055 [Macrolepiota fuliginosa MF-IS2]|uniref:Uncharacterized protein n=1 Tax=Macrolepiota fuliginosa MF-IS2 TaxID=1400762 RepID=A0A9P5XI31_9AGAR|nr:hypothetical protein P691DRAFT_433055 [Macrolepiota fuliginosa MF-IS2]
MSHCVTTTNVPLRIFINASGAWRYKPRKNIVTCWGSLESVSAGRCSGFLPRTEQGKYLLGRMMHGPSASTPRARLIFRGMLPLGLKSYESLYVQTFTGPNKEDLWVQWDHPSTPTAVSPRKAEYIDVAPLYYKSAVIRIRQIVKYTHPPSFLCLRGDAE